MKDLALHPIKSHIQSFVTQAQVTCHNAEVPERPDIYEMFFLQNTFGKANKFINLVLVRRQQSPAGQGA